MTIESSVKYSSNHMERSDFFNYLAQGKNGTLLIFDIDDFKYVNFSFGYSIGNRIIDAVINRIRDTFGGIVSRVGSNRIAVFIDKMENIKNLREKCKKHMQSISFKVKNEVFKISLSCGIACGNSRELFREAEMALLKAKSSGKATVVFCDKKNTWDQQQFLKTRKSIVTAIKNNNVKPYFQPIVDLRTNRIYGYEVLARILDNNNALHGDYVIRTADSLGLTPDIDKNIFLKAMPYINKKYHLFVNLSMKYYVRELNFVWHTVKSRNISLDNVVFEITESQEIVNKRLAQSLISIFKDIHAKIAIDDFGAGYSNFNYLKLFPIDIVKIDGAFIKNIKNNLKDLAIVRSIVDISKYFKFKTLAEFIEDAETFDILKEAGVALGQGYFIGKPQPEPYKPKFMVK